MSNHYHIVVRINSARAEHWSDREVAERWTRLFREPMLVKRFLAGKFLSTAEHDHVASLLSTWRKRLLDLSWFMRCLNEPIARIANKEDRCTGRFWEGRFTSQALLDERAVLTCMAYVDLNPIRAALATTLEQSDYTSIQERILNPENHALRPFAEHVDDEAGIPFCLKDYLEVVEWAGREIKCGKKGSISKDQPPILNRLGMDAAPILDYLRRTEKQSFGALGSVSLLRMFAHSMERRFIKGLSLGRSLFPEPG